MEVAHWAWVGHVLAQSSAENVVQGRSPAALGGGGICSPICFE